MTQENKLSRKFVIGGVLAAFGLAFGLGAVTVSSRSEQDGVSTTQADAKDAGGIALIYKIPVSLSQAVLGPSDALVTIVEWCDFPDAGCMQLDPAIKTIMRDHEGDVRLVFRHFANASSEGSAKAHEFSRIAHERGQFWAARDLLLVHQGELTMADLEQYAGTLGLEWSGVKTALDGKTHAGHVAADRLFAQMFDVKASSAFFVNGRPLADVSAPALVKAVQGELARAKSLLAGGVEKKDIYAEVTKNGVWTPLPKR